MSVKMIDISRASESLAGMVADWYGGTTSLPNARISADVIAQRLNRFEMQPPDVSRECACGVECQDHGAGGGCRYIEAVRLARQTAMKPEDIAAALITEASTAWDKCEERRLEAEAMRAALGRALALFDAMIANDPNEPVSDAGHTALDMWKHEAEQLRVIAGGN
jgi:hypothetical protein